MEAVSTSSPSPPSEEPQGFVAHVGTTEAIAVQLDPPVPSAPEPTFTVAQVREIAYQAAGAGTGVLMQTYPDGVFPSAEVAAAVKRVLVAFGVTA